MSIRNMIVQYIGKVLFLPKFEREVTMIVERDTGREYKLERTCIPLGEWERITQTQLVRHRICTCGHELGMDEHDEWPFNIKRMDEMPNFCPNCGAKVVEE